MGKLKTVALSSAAMLAACVVVAAPAGASLISIGLQEAGVNGGAITTVATGSPVADFNGSYGTYAINTVSGSESSPLGQIVFDSNTINATANHAGGTLDVFVTESDITLANLRHWESTFTANLLTGAVTSVTEWTALDTSNGVFTTPLLLGGPVTFTDTGTDTVKVVENPGGLYSLTEKYQITATGVGSANSTIDILGTPEPSTWAMMLLGFAGLGFLGFRQGRKTSTAIA